MSYFLFKSKIAVLSIIIFSFCSSASAKLNVFTSILPQSYIVERIAGDLVDISVLIPKGQGPTTYNPIPSQIKKLSSCDIYFTIGVPFENAFKSKFVQILKNTKIVDSSTGIKKLKLEDHDDDQDDKHDEHEHHGEDHGHKHHHEHGDFDPHVWMSPVNTKIIATNIYNNLVKLLPNHKIKLKTKLNMFLNDLNKVHNKIQKVLKGQHGKSVFVFHPAFGHFLELYGMKQKAVEVEGKSPSPKQIMRLIKEAKKSKVKVIFIQPQFDIRSAKIIANAINGKVEMIDPLEKNLIMNYLNISKALQKDAI